MSTQTPPQYGAHEVALECSIYDANSFYDMAQDWLKARGLSDHDSKADSMDLIRDEDRVLRGYRLYWLFDDLNVALLFKLTFGGNL